MVEEYPEYSASIERLKGEVKVVKKQIAANSNIKRVIKGGEITHLEGGKSSNKIGFRCVLPFTGAPVLKDYKVKWE